MENFSVTDYINFKKQHNFECAKLTQKDGNIYLNGEVVQETVTLANGNKQTITHYQGDNFLCVTGRSNICVGSSLSPESIVKFKFRGKTADSLSSVLEAINYQDKKLQKLALTNDLYKVHPSKLPQPDTFWGQDSCVYWQGKPILRHSNEYQLFLDELFVALLNNPLFRLAISCTKNKYLLCNTYNNDPHQTLLTREEYETRLNTLRDFYNQSEIEYIKRK